MRFASFLSGGFTTMAVINPPEKKMAKCTNYLSILIFLGSTYKGFTNFNHFRYLGSLAIGFEDIQSQMINFWFQCFPKFGDF